MIYEPVNLQRKFSLFTDHWRPRVIAQMNDDQFKLVKIQGEFVWHDHQDTDEAFIVIDGTLRIDFEDGQVTLGPGELYVVPKGVQHKPYAAEGVQLMLIEPRGVTNTGEVTDDTLTAENDVWIRRPENPPGRTSRNVPAP